MNEEKLTRMWLTKVSQNGVKMLQNIVTGCNVACPNAIKILKLGHSSPCQTVCGEV